MAMLSGPEIERQVKLGNIVIDPFDPRQLNSNSYNVRLGKVLKVLVGRETCEHLGNEILDLHVPPAVQAVEIGSTGFLLRKGNVYLGHTVERISCDGYVPCIDGRSTVARYGVSVHITAGFGDDGFDGTFTLELEARHMDTIVHENDLIAQVHFDTLIGIRMPYTGTYQGQDEPREPKPLTPWKG